MSQYPGGAAGDTWTLLTADTSGLSWVGVTQQRFMWVKETWGEQEGELDLLGAGHLGGRGQCQLPRICIYQALI